MTFVKGHKLATGRPKGSKNKETLAREERRAIFEARVSEKFLETIDKARPEYLLDQFLGKAPDILKAEVQTEHTGEDVAQLAQLAAQLLKKKKL